MRLTSAADVIAVLPVGQRVTYGFLRRQLRAHGRPVTGLLRPPLLDDRRLRWTWNDGKPYAAFHVPGKTVRGPLFVEVVSARDEAPKTSWMDRLSDQQSEAWMERDLLDTINRAAVIDVDSNSLYLMGAEAIGWDWTEEFHAARRRDLRLAVRRHLARPELVTVGVDWGVDPPTMVFFETTPNPSHGLWRALWAASPRLNDLSLYGFSAVEIKREPMHRWWEGEAVATEQDVISLLRYWDGKTTTWKNESRVEIISGSVSTIKKCCGRPAPAGHAPDCPGLSDEVELMSEETFKATGVPVGGATSGVPHEDVARARRDELGALNALIEAFERGENLFHTGRLVVNRPVDDSSCQMVLDEDD
jgi:hypothetical protein